jgi:hypothetical protein
MNPYAWRHQASILFSGSNPAGPARFAFFSLNYSSILSISLSISIDDTSRACVSSSYLLSCLLGRLSACLRACWENSEAANRLRCKFIRHGDRELTAFSQKKRSEILSLPNGKIVTRIVITIVATFVAVAAIFVLSPLTGAQTTAESTASETCSQSSAARTNSTLHGPIGDAVGLNLYLNGSGAQAGLSFNVRPGAESFINITANYPWQNVPSTSSECVEVLFTIGPFPANSNQSTIPNWIHVSFSTPYLDIVNGTKSSVNLIISADNVNVSAANGTVGAFMLESHYLDPASGISATEETGIALTA